MRGAGDKINSGKPLIITQIFHWESRALSVALGVLSALFFSTYPRYVEKNSAKIASQINAIPFRAPMKIWVQQGSNTPKMNRYE
jgi:hypothetical protein